MSINGTLEIISLSDEDLKNVNLKEKNFWKNKVQNEGTKFLDIKKPTNRRCPWIFTLSVVAALIGGPVPAGFNIAALNTSQGLFEDFIHSSLTNRQQCFKVENIFTCTSSLFCVTAACGCFFGTYLCDHFGRKKSFYLNVVLLLMGSGLALFSKLANYWEMLLIGRVIVGINAGATSVITTTYLSEISPNSIRGSIGSLYQFGLIVGLLFANTPGFSFVLGQPDRIHFIFLIPICLGIAHMLLLIFCPESPKYLFIDKDDYSEAKACLLKLRGNGSSERLADEIEDISKENNLLKKEPEVGLQSFITRLSIRRPLIVACVLAISNQTTGINAFSFYSTRIFESAIAKETLEAHPDFPRFVTTLISVSMLGGTAASMCLIEKMGRKYMLITSLTVIALCMVSVGFLLSDMAMDDSIKCPAKLGHSQTSYYLACAVTLTYSTVCSFGPGPLAWLMAPELFTLQARCTGTSIANFMEWISAFFIATTFPYLASWLCGFSFFVFGLTTALMIVFFAKFLPKIDGLSTYEINRIFLKLEN